MKELLELFLTFAKIGVMTFGGGMAMLPILEREVVQNKHWATEEELVDYFAIGQCTPGIIAVNTATFVGQKRKGAMGGITATLGVVFPSLVIITILAGLITNFAHLAWVQNAFAGIQVCVCVLILNAVLKLLKKSVVDKRTAVIFVIVLLGNMLLSVSPVWFVLLSALSGIVLKILRGRRQNDLVSSLILGIFKTGLFAIGGGMATLPFLKDIGATTGWFSQTDLMNMLAVSESTPGPVGINMATYVGYTVGGVPGAIVATIGEVTPSIIVILIVAAMLAKFRDSQYVANAFYGLRPASTGLIGAACAGVMLQVIAGITSVSQEDSILMKFSWDGAISWRGIILALVLLVFTRYIKKTKDLHPIVFIGVSAVIGVVFHFAGV